MSLSLHWNLLNRFLRLLSRSGRGKVQRTESGPVLLVSWGITVNVGTSNKNLTAASLRISSEILVSPADLMLQALQTSSPLWILDGGEVVGWCRA